MELYADYYHRCISSFEKLCLKTKYNVHIINRRLIQWESI